MEHVILKVSIREINTRGASDKFYVICYRKCEDFMQKVIKHHSPNEKERYIQMGLFRGLNSGTCLSPTGEQA